jgi:Ni/Co efflux regulator RcnB
MVLALATGGLSHAQGRYDNDRNDRSSGDRYDRGEQRGGNNDERRNDRNDGYRNERGAGPEHAFRRGERLPAQYRRQQYVVDDWRGHRLSAPPRGYHWVQTGGDYVLAAIATGVILQLMLSN